MGDTNGKQRLILVRADCTDPSRWFLSPAIMVVFVLLVRERRGERSSRKEVYVLLLDVKGESKDLFLHLLLLSCLQLRTNLMPSGTSWDSISWSFMPLFTVNDWFLHKQKSFVSYDDFSFQCLPCLKAFVQKYNGAAMWSSAF